MTETDPKERIRLAAHDLVMKYSIRSVSMDDIAGSLGMSKKTLYQYYKDKNELVNAVVEGVIEENQCACNDHIELADNAIHEIFLAMEMMVEMFQTMNPSIIYDLQKYHAAAFQQFYQHKTNFLYSTMVKNLERGIKEELYRADLNVDVLARFRVESMFIPFDINFQKSLSNFNLLEIEEQIIRNFLFGLVSLKGYKLAMKYMDKREKQLIKSKKI